MNLEIKDILKCTGGILLTGNEEYECESFSRDTRVIKKGDTFVAIKGETFDGDTFWKEAFENGTSVAWANDNTEVIAFSLQNKGYTVGIPELGSADSIAPAVTKGNDTLLNWINDEITSLGEENFFHADYEATLADTYGMDYEDSLVVEGGKTE